MKYFYKVFVFSFFFLFAYVHASVNSLNGQMGASQTFVNDDNFTITSNSDVHTLGWNGVLSVSRGGLGIDSSSFSTGSIPFFDGTNFTQSSKLNWDDSSSLMYIRGDIIFTADNDPVTNRLIATADQSSGDLSGTLITIKPGNGHGTGDGGEIVVVAGDGGDTGNGGNAQFIAGTGGATSGNGGNVYITAGNGIAGDSNGGDIILTPGNFSLSGKGGHIKILDVLGAAAILNTSNLYSSDQEFKFPDASGTFSLLESSQEFIGVNTFSNPINNFISTTNSTVHIGADGFPGCIVMGDSDGSGVTYITADNGVLSASTSAPANCN